MERLTFEGNFCDIAMCRENPCPYNGSCTQREVWERLKAYEDAGISPAADVAPVVHGRWVHIGRRFKGGVDWCHCSECGGKNNFAARTNYCPNCGAKMDGEP